jgi:hypothetical protein
MPKSIQRLLMLLTVLAVGFVQAVGIHAGYLCQCTGQVVAKDACEAEACHPGEHEHDDEGHEHGHTAIHTELEATMHPDEGLVPPPVFYALPVVPWLEEALIAQLILADENAAAPPPRPPEDTGQATWLQLVETSVLLI